MVSNIEHGSYTPIDCDNVPTPGATRSGDTRLEIDSRSGSRPSSDGLTCIEQGAQRGSSEDSAVPEPGPEIGYFS